MGKLWINPSNGCWVDVWDQPGGQGRHTRLVGPVDLPYLRVADEQWEPVVGSMLVGPNAYVLCYEDTNFDESAYWLLPNQRVDDVSDLRCSDEIDCVRIYDRPPFAAEPGFAAYMLWATGGAAHANTMGHASVP